MPFEKTNPRLTWTFDLAPLPPPPTAPAAAPNFPTNLQTAGAILRAICPFPDAHRAVLAGLRAFWPPSILPDDGFYPAPAAT